MDLKLVPSKVLIVFIADIVKSFLKFAVFHHVRSKLTRWSAFDEFLKSFYDFKPLENVNMISFNATTFVGSKEISVVGKSST